MDFTSWVVKNDPQGYSTKRESMMATLGMMPPCGVREYVVQNGLIRTFPWENYPNNISLPADKQMLVSALMDAYDQELGVQEVACPPPPPKRLWGGG